jgi:uncharacterized protein (TIGR03118 family)
MKAQIIALLTAAICARAQNSYAVRKLVSDLPGAAEHTDSNLRNPWGLASSGASPFWVSNEVSGTATVYDSDGSGFPSDKPIVVKTPGAPTGQVFNDTGAFELQPGKPALFLFCTEGGVIAGWNNVVDPAAAITKVDNSGSASYTGLAVARTTDGPRLYAANFAAGTIDAFDGNFNPIPTPDEFRGPVSPGYGPFNIQKIGQRLYVSFAPQDRSAGGFVNVYSLDGRLIAPLIRDGGPLNSPWGLTMAPENFGAFSQALLVGNFGDGTIHAFEPCSGEWLGAVADTNGKPIVLPGLWALRAGNGHNGGEAGALYLTAGIPGPDEIESHGLLGAIRPAPPAPADYDVDIRNLKFNPDAIEVPAGAVLTWTNGDGFAHSVMGDTSPFASDVMAQGAKFSQTFDTPGTYEYHCAIHPFMRGKVVVK